jgi:hypothetical protein
VAHGRDLVTKAEALADAVDRFRAGNSRIDIGTFPGAINLILPAVVAGCRASTPAATSGCSRWNRTIRGSAISICCSANGRFEGDVKHVELLDEPYPRLPAPGAFPAGPVRAKLLGDVPMVAWPHSVHQKWLERTDADAGARPRICSEPPATKPSCRWCGRASARRCCHGYWPAGRTQSPLAARAIDIAVEGARALARQM